MEPALGADVDAAVAQEVRDAPGRAVAELAYVEIVVHLWTPLTRAGAPSRSVFSCRYVPAVGHEPRAAQAEESQPRQRSLTPARSLLNSSPSCASRFMACRRPSAYYGSIRIPDDSPTSSGGARQRVQMTGTPASIGLNDNTGIPLSSVVAGDARARGRI